MAIPIAHVAAGIHESRGPAVDCDRRTPLGRGPFAFESDPRRSNDGIGSCRAALPRDAPQAKGGAMKDARGLDVTGDDLAAVAAADDFAARLLRLDQGAEAILDAAKRWPDTPIVQLYAAAFWLYGQTEGALENAAAHLRASARSIGRSRSGMATTICARSRRWRRSPPSGRAIS